jgi:outer membrane protein assembly factor BamB
MKMGLRKRLRDFRNWCPQPSNPLPTKLKQYSVPIAVLLTVTLLAASFSIFYSSIPFAAADWPMFHGDPSRNGVGTGSPVLTPTLLWNYTTGGGVLSSPAIVNGVVYIASADDNVYALNAANGRKLWNYTMGGDPGVSSPAVVDGKVYIGSEIPAGANGFIGVVYALNAANGAKLWSYTTGNYYNYVDSSPAVVNGVVYIGSSVGLALPPPSTLAIILGTVYALNATNGDKLWNYTTDSSVDSSPAIVNGVVYVGSEDGYVYALNAINGVQLWNYQTGGGVYSSPAVFNQVIYVGSGLGVYALNAASGSKIWNYNTDSSVESSPAIVNGIVYFGSSNNVYALNATNGGKLWNYTTGNGVNSSPAVVSGVVYISSFDGNLYALNATSGSKIWNYYANGFGYSSPAIVNSIVYIGGGNSVYALGDSSATSPSPTSSNTLPVIIGVAIAVLIVAIAVLLMFQKRLKKTAANK